MTWVKIDQETFEDPKIEAVSPIAGWFWLAALCYCNKHRTDGRIGPVGIAKIAASAKVRQIDNVLEELGRLDMAYPDDSEDGAWWLVNYAKYQPLSDRLAREREQTRQRVARYRAGHVPHDPTDRGGNGTSNAARNGVTANGMVLPERPESAGRPVISPEALDEMRQRKRRWA